MGLGNAVQKYFFSNGGEAGNHDSPKNSGTVLKWPLRQEGVADEIKKVDEILHKLSYQPHQAAAAPVEPDNGPLLLVKRTSEKTTLRGEMPAAIKAYDLALAAVREYFTVISQKKTFDLAPLEESVTRLVDSLARNSDALLCISKMHESDAYIYAHAVNVGIYASAFALNCGKSYSEAVSIGLAGLMHDTGMALLPIALLVSSDELSPTEQVLVKRHPIIACEILSAFPNVPNDVFTAALEHHERFDGSGYPAGLSGSGISFIGHLIAICNTFDAMTASRRHRTPVNTHTALGEMFMQRNKQFHPVMLESFIKMIGVYPVGSVVVLQDGYCGVVTASPRKSPTRPVVTLVKDPKGHSMSPLEFDMSQERLASIVQCVSAADQGVDAHAILGMPEKLSR